MQWNILFLCSVLWLFLPFFDSACTCSQKHQKCRHERCNQTHQKPDSVKSFCDLSNKRGGAITQKCGSGFYREWTGPDRGQCVPCSCNGLSNECEEPTGNCVNCRLNTTGDRCEQCKEGYYGTAANRACHACPCPFTWSNSSLACLDIGSGVFECLCKRGYRGTRCERCAIGHYGNPMLPGGSCKPCNCTGSLNVCHSLTGECITSGNYSSCDHVHEWDLEKIDDVLARLKLQLQNISHVSDSVSKLNTLDANSSEATILVGRYCTAVRHLDPKIQQLEVDVNAVKVDLSQLTDESLLQNVKVTKLEAEDLLSEGEALLTATQELMKQLPEVEAGGSTTLSVKDKVRMMGEAQNIIEQMRESGCTVNGEQAGSEQDETQKLLEVVNLTSYVESNQAALSQRTNSLMASGASVRELAALLSDAEDRVGRALNLKSAINLHRLQNRQTPLESEQTMLLSMTERTTEVIQNISDIFLMLEDLKTGSEHHAAQLDGSWRTLVKTLNNMRLMAKADIVTNAEECAEELNTVAADFQQVLDDATNSTDLLSVLDTGDYHFIINTIESAETAAHQSFDRVLKDSKGGVLLSKAEGLKDNSTRLQTEANETHSDLKTLSHSADAQRDGVSKQKEKGKSLLMEINTVVENLRKIQRDNTEALIESVNTAAANCNNAVRIITERSKKISQEVETQTFTTLTVTVDDMLHDADRTLKSLSSALPVLRADLTRVEALSRRTSPGPNMTESIRRIKDVIEETRNFVNRVVGAPGVRDSWCGRQRTHRSGYQLSENHSWISYNLPQQDLNYRPHFSLDVKTKSSKGLIFHVAGRGAIPMLALYMANGKMKMSIGQNRIIQHKEKSNDGNWHRVEFSVEQSTFHLLVDGIRVTDGHLPNNEGSSLDFHGHVYLGSDERSKTPKRHNIPMDSIFGCIRDFKMNDVAVGIPEASHRALPCLDGPAVIGTYFTGGYIVLDNYFTVGSDFVLAFELRPQHLTGLLFHVQSLKTSLNVFLMGNRVGVIVNDGSSAVSVSVTPPDLCDGEFHLVTVSKQQEVITLTVDSMSDQKASPSMSTSISTILDSLYIGGMTEHHSALVSSPFVGCMRNVNVNGRLVAFEAESRVVGHVSINGCPSY